MWPLLIGIAHADPSALWGDAGERWDPRGRLPDFSWAGYHAGERPLPSAPVTAVVTAFGAVGDGVTDDTAAFQAAIDATTGVLHVPAGTWVVRDVLTLRHGDLVLRGDGPDRTVIRVDIPLAAARGPRPEWSWEGGFLWVDGGGAMTRTATLTAPAARGDRAVHVDDATGLTAGDWVLLRLHESGGGLARHLHNDQASGGDCAWQADYRVDLPLRVSAIAGHTVTFEQPLRLDARLDWTPDLSRVHPLTEIGFEGFTLAFPDVPYAGHLLEPGYNGIYLARGVADAWVRDVRFEHADNAVLTGWWTKRLTLTGLTFTGRPGHHGVNLSYLSDGRMEDAHFAQPYRHEITVDHRAHGCVFTRVSSEGQPVSLDHHRDAPFENLFTNFSAPTDWDSGGARCAGPSSGARTTAWNLRPPLRAPAWGYVQANVVGALAGEAIRTADREWYEPVTDLHPADLHDAQLRRRLGRPPPALEGPPDTAAPSRRAWQRALPWLAVAAAALLAFLARRRSRA